MINEVIVGSIKIKSRKLLKLNQNYDNTNNKDI